MIELLGLLALIVGTNYALEIFGDWIATREKRKTEEYVKELRRKAHD